MISEENFDSVWESVRSQDFQVKGKPHGWIQWKGTDVCIDLHCECGFHGHYDGDFFYWWQCPKCNREYAVSSNVALIPLSGEQANWVESNHVGFKVGDTD